MTTERPRTAFVTGCTPGGIGHALALEYQAKGLRVIASARRAEVVDDLKAQGFEAIVLDVSDPESIKKAHKEVFALTDGKLDILVNNAGKSYSVAATDITLEGIQSTFATNLFGIMLIVMEFVPLLIAAKGKIVNIGSVAAIIPYAFGSVYNASKAALHSYGDTLRVELEPFGVQVITVVTGGVKSNIADKNPQSMPEYSIFYGMNDLYVTKRRGSSQKNALSAEAYASYVVAQTLKPHTRPWLWQGNFSFTIWLSTFFPIGFMDGVMSRMFGLAEFKQRLAAAPHA